MARVHGAEMKRRSSHELSGLTTERLMAASGRTRPAPQNVSRFADRRPGDVAGWSIVAGAKVRRQRWRVAAH